MIKIKEKLEKIRLDLIKSNNYELFNKGEITFDIFEYENIGTKSCNFRVLEEDILIEESLQIPIKLFTVHDTLAEDDLISHIIDFFKTQKNCKLHSFCLNKYCNLLEEFGEVDTELLEPLTCISFNFILTIHE